ncbi:putative LPS assembly protein LptD [Formosa algae]|uniref:Lipopolysaccharide assembly outer membrane protein LptD (OstA) n=1 Tax=Formosa algae TaxID=225843 RepID=A0A9X1C9Y7_9FLAO|nr:putative LPS assembly protein LptD [Formosa algae]MBP1841158.1 lipopolysaccharide assembly outer membrane protein LptD (OstA) [Formosa algae]MDQ0336422.1 lipopolysaccharide assembly outer membrane protein LptD (OstA) [Formosa algae]OEI81386.1 organic solvent tolerance protein OstA [Formosa algae]PNW27922.1 organic solvent tolerance protein OstA [Formosa algae]
MRSNYFQILLALSFTVLINTYVFSQDLPRPVKVVKATTQDPPLFTPIISVDSLAVSQINERAQDSVLHDSVKPKDEFLTDIVTYSAVDYTSFNRLEQKLYLYNEAEVDYQDMNIKAGVIVIDYSKNEVYAGRIKDSTGAYTQKPVFTQGQSVVEPDSIRFNFDTQKALIFNSKTEQSGFNILAPIVKKESDSVIYMAKAKFTTSDDVENPEYYFKASKIKYVPDKKVVVGPTNMVIADVPTPIAVPFGFFPLTDKQTSGIIIPSFGEDSDRGYFLQNGGYYFAMSDYADLTILGDYYTNGSYGLNIESNYALKYKFSGSMSFRYESLIDSEKGFPDYSKSTIYNIRWSHSQDSKSNPNSSFSASVNLGSSSYYQTSVNQLNTGSYLNNTLSSSVAYSKSFTGSPQVNLSVAATHSQNTTTEVINMSLPNISGSVERVYPFAPKTGTKSGIIDNINFQYTVDAENQIETTDSLFFKPQMFKDAEAGVQHSVPISTNFKLFKYLSLSAGTSFEENWTFKTINRYYDQDLDETVTETINGFDAYRTYNFSTSLGTTIYGMFDFEKEGKDRKIQAIRHVMRPSISYSITPSFDQYYETYEVISTEGTALETYSRFEESIYGAPNENFSSSLGLSLANNLEAKVTDSDSTATEAKKITLLNSLTFSTSYNFAGDSLQWSPLRISGGTSILDSKMNINFGATLDPYALDNTNTKVDVYNINNNGSLFRLTSANLTLSYSLSNELFSGESKEDDKGIQENLRGGGRDDDLFGVSQDFTNNSFFDSDEDEEDEEDKKNDNEFYRYKIPWTLNLAYAVNYSNTTRNNEISSNSLMFSGDVSLSPRWSVGVSSGYDFKDMGFTYTQLRLERDLLSWRMNFSWVPFGTSKSWYFFIGIKSSILSDLKYDKRLQSDKSL